MYRQGGMKRGLAAALLILGGMLVAVAGQSTPRALPSGQPVARTARHVHGQGESDLGGATDSTGQMTAKQRKELMKDNFEKMKHDADELASLAKALQEELDKSSENVLSLQIVDKAEKIERLAKRIKSTARGN